MQLLINPPNNLTYPLDIQKADRYRLEHLKNGGIYADFDLNMNYTCVMNYIKDFKGEMLALDFQEKGWEIKVANGFFYVPPDNTSLIKEILANEGKSKDCTTDPDSIPRCNGGFALQKYRNRITLSPEVTRCMRHSFDHSWYKDSTRDEKNKKPNK